MSGELLDVAVSEAGRGVVLSWRDGRTTTAPAPWLFDSATDPNGHASGHRRHGALETATRALLSARVESAELVLCFAPDGETRRISISALSARPSPIADRVDLWDSPGRLDSSPIAFGAYLADDEVLAEALSRVARHGIVFFADAGQQPRTVERAVARFGYVRETNYGRLFDVREEPAASHLAYTAVGLELHTDNPYRDPEPTLQLLHVIETAAEGGESQFVDGFAQAERLRREAPSRFDVLASTAVEFAYVGPEGEHYATRAPVIETLADGRLKAMRVNHRAFRPPALASGVAEAWYDAYLDIYQRLHAPSARLARQLGVGELVMFDNRRVLHGRSPYGGAGGRRWLQGCYAERDGLLATLSRLRAAS